MPTYLMINIMYNMQIVTERVRAIHRRRKRIPGITTEAISG